jgi:hypothetical protein
MARYYAGRAGPERLLRPMTRARRPVLGRLRTAGPLPQWWQRLGGLYQGTVLADDIEQLAQDCSGAEKPPGTAPTGDLLGNHDDDGRCRRPSKRRSSVRCAR